MTYCRGRTLKPASGTLKFTIDVNPSLPGPQYWEQFWTCCEGPEPFLPKNKKTEAVCQFGSQEVDAPFHENILNLGSIDTDNLLIELSPNEGSLQITEDVIDTMEREKNDYERCRNLRRTLKIEVISFNIEGNGDAIVTTSYGLEEIAISLKLFGTNPSRQLIAATLPNDIMKAICWQESRWKQFSNGKPLEGKNGGGRPSDWGMMQINGATNRERWHWRENINRAIEIYNEKVRHAKRYLDKHIPYTPEMLQKESIQRYNGGAYYKWDSGKEKWIAAPKNKYVEFIERHLASKPWSIEFREIGDAS